MATIGTKGFAMIEGGHKSVFFFKVLWQCSGEPRSVAIIEDGCSSGVAIKRGSTGCYRYCQCRQYIMYTSVLGVIGYKRLNLG